MWFSRYVWLCVRSTKLDKTSLSFTNGLALSSSVACLLVLTKLLSANADGELRTLYPLLARQVLSQLSYTPMFHGCGSTLAKAIPILLFVYPLTLFSWAVGLSGPFLPSERFPFRLPLLLGSGLKWTRTTDLTLIRRAL